MSRPQESSARDVAWGFDGRRLTVARHLAGLRKSELAARISRPDIAVAGWESGSTSPTAVSVALLATSLGVEPGFFAARSEGAHAFTPLPHFRSLRSTTQLARDQAHAYGRMALDVCEALERRVELPAVDVPDLPVDLTDRLSAAPEQVARAVRTAWDLGSAPVNHVLRTVELHGVLVAFSPPQASSVDAYSFAGRPRPVVILNGLKDDYYRQRFDVAHELGHLVMHGDAEPGSSIAEDQANRFAAELLMPEDVVRELLPSRMQPSTWRELARAKEAWGVSMQALLFRARRLGCLSDASYRSAMVTVSARGWRRDEPGLVDAVEQPSLLPQAMELLAGLGVDEAAVASEARVPVTLFRTVVARTPERPVGTPPAPASTQQVLSLLPRNAC